MNNSGSAFIGSIPENYDSGLGPYLFEFYASDLARRTASCSPSSVLELAAGTGIVSRRIRDELPNDCEFIASDLNSPMLEVAKSKFEPEEYIEFSEVDALNIGFGDNRFDVVVCQFGVMFFPDKDRACKEVCRVLKRNGSYLFSVWDSWDSNEFARVAHEMGKKIFPEDPPQFYRVPFSYFDPNEIRGSLETAGFGNVEIETVCNQVAVPSMEHFAGGLVYGNPLFDEIQNRGGDPGKFVEALSLRLKENFGTEISIQAFVVRATCLKI